MTTTTTTTTISITTVTTILSSLGKYISHVGELGKRKMRDQVYLFVCLFAAGSPERPSFYLGENKSNPVCLALITQASEGNFEFTTIDGYHLGRLHWGTWVLNSSWTWIDKEKHKVWTPTELERSLVFCIVRGFSSWGPDFFRGWGKGLCS